ncbi:MAG: response regulator, partial [Steroidobacteraceae bacterium]
AGVYDTEFRVRTRTGEYRWFRSRGTCDKDANGKPLRVSGALQDITERRQYQHDLIEAQEASAAANRAKGEFLANMSHEIRTPMTGIVGMTRLLLEARLSPVQRDYVETVRASADSLLTILNDILDFSKIEAGKLEIENLQFDLRSQVDEVGCIMAFQAAAKNLELIVNVRPEVPTRVVGDPQRIGQCLLNLLSNAIKFTASGEVVLEVYSPELQGETGLVHFEVRDTGIGIAASQLDRLFQPFTQADTSTTRRFGGTGLGLSIVCRLVAMMGGQSGASSQAAKGSTFWFTLPLPAVPAGDAAQAHQPGSHDVHARVLLVDDNVTNQRVLSSQMTHAGYEVEAASSAPEALQRLRAAGAAPFDIAVLDYQMPDMDGAALGERIMKSEGIARPRLVLLSSVDRADDTRRFAELGFAAYLIKPVRTRELLDCLRRTLSHQTLDPRRRSPPIITRGTLVASKTWPQYAGRVLLVEDNAVNQRVMQRFLERLGCKVEIAGDGAQAVQAYARSEYDLVLMDIQMPVMDGLEACRRIRETAAGGRRTPIVALTADAVSSTLDKCLQADMDGYLTKPLDISRLQDVLDRFVATAPAKAAARA